VIEVGGESKGKRDLNMSLVKTSSDVETDRGFFGPSKAYFSAV